MPGLFQLDTDELVKDPNLKFVPQNASAHLTNDHPTFQQLKEGLTPEQIEILETVSQVDNFDVDEVVEDDIELVDPETGEAEKLSEDDITLDDLGFIDPSNMRKITLEAFNSFKLEHVNALIKERYDELTAKRNNMFRTGTVSRLEANNINDLLGGSLYDNVIMESFTNSPTKVNYNLVMEEISNGQKALMAGGAIVGATILYKLIKWCLNAWNKNSIANKSIGDNINAIRDRRTRLRHADNIIQVTQKAFNEAKRKYEAGTKGDLADKEFAEIINKFGDVSKLTDINKAKALAEELVINNIRRNLKNDYSNLWLTMFSGSPVNFNNGSFKFDKTYVDKMQAAVQAAIELTNSAKAKIEEVGTTTGEKTVSTSNDESYKKAISIIAEWAKVNGFVLNAENFTASCSEFASHVNSSIVKNLTSEIPDNAVNVNLDFLDSTTFAVVSDDFLKDINEFGDMLAKEGGDGKKKQGTVNVGDDVQRDSRLHEYKKATEHFQAAMNIIRAVHNIRNNVGRGLTALRNSYSE